MFGSWTDTGSFPGIQNVHDIRGNRRWILGVLQENSSTPNLFAFKNAKYFQCGGERRNIVHEEFEAWQPVGTTDLSDEMISRIGNFPFFLINSLLLISVA
jgi:hypothetical protein